MTEQDELIEQGPFLRSIGQGFLLEDDMHEYEHGLNSDQRFRSAKSTADRWEGHHNGLEHFHDGEKAGSYVMWLVVIGFAAWAIVEISKHVYG